MFGDANAANGRFEGGRQRAVRDDGAVDTPAVVPMAGAAGGGSIEACSLAKDLAPPARSGVTSAVLAVPLPLKRERRPLPRAVSSPPKALRERLHPQILAQYWLGTGQLLVP